MPELPEVETIARQLAPVLEGRRLEALEILDRERLQLPGAAALRNTTVTEVRRRGKHVGFSFRPPRARRATLWLNVHLRMTGQLLWAPRRCAPPPHLRARFRFRGGELQFIDVRRFGTLQLTDRWEEARPAGIDPTDPAFTPARLRELLRGSGQAIKPWLLRQDRLAGLGNIYASEALFAARLHPERAAGTIDGRAAERLHRELTELLARAIAARGTTLSDYADATGARGGFAELLQVYGREGEPCPRCGRAIARLIQHSRSTFYCARCQPRPRGS